MTWDTDGSRIDDDEWAGDRTRELHGDEWGLPSALDRVNIAWLVDRYPIAKHLLLVPMVTAGPEVCKLSAERLARDCKLTTRTVERYRSAFVSDGVLERILDKDGRTIFRFVWQTILNLAGEGLMRRPARERVNIIESTFRTIVDRNVLPINRDWLERWADPSTPSRIDPMPGRLGRQRETPRKAPPTTATTTPSSVSGGERRQCRGTPTTVTKTPSSVSGPSEPDSEPEGNLNPNQKTHNGSAYAAEHEIGGLRPRKHRPPRPSALRSWRLARGWSQYTLADQLGCTRGFIGSIEQGRAPLSRNLAERLAALGFHQPNGKDPQG